MQARADRWVTRRLHRRQLPGAAHELPRVAFGPPSRRPKSDLDHLEVRVSRGPSRGINLVTQTTTTNNLLEGPGRPAPTAPRAASSRTTRPQPARLLGDHEHAGRRERQRRRLPALLRHADLGRRARLPGGRRRPATTRSTTTTTRSRCRPARPAGTSTSSIRLLRHGGDQRHRRSLVQRHNAVSSWYELYDTRRRPTTSPTTTPRSPPRAPGSPNLAPPTRMGGSGGSECSRSNAYGDGRDYHDAWYLLNPGAPLSGGALGTVYRIHTTGTDPATRPPSGTRTASRASPSTPGCHRRDPAGVRPRVPCRCSPRWRSGAAAVSEFYLAQFRASHAGKTLEIRLWDPGDTNPLTACLSILCPDEGGVDDANFSYTSARGSTNSGRAQLQRRPARRGESVTTATPTSAVQRLLADHHDAHPVGYTAPQDGWWKIRYTMSGPARRTT